MSAIVLGKRSSGFFEELHLQPSPASAAKKARFGSSSFRLSPVRGSQTGLDHLLSMFPDMEEQLLERVLEASGNDLESAIKSLTQLQLGSNICINLSETADQSPVEGISSGGSEETDESCPTLGGSEWVDILVREMMNAANMDDAKARAAAVLEAFEKAVASHSSAAIAKTLQKEQEMLKGQVEGLIRENEILKKAVVIQHERQKEFDEKAREISELKQVVGKYQEQIRTLEVNNYALSLHLRQAQQSSSIPGRFHPDVF